MKPISVKDYLWNVAKFPIQPICVVYGEDAFLRSSAVRHIQDQVLAAEEAEFAVSRFDGDTAKLEFKEVYQALRTSAMFGGERRVVRVDEADTFVSKNRDKLEKYIANPSEQAVLILQLKSFDPKTNLFKKLVTSGLLIEAKPLSEKEMSDWILQWSKLRHKTHCDKDAAAMIIERIGVEHGFGLIDQELSKLSLMVMDKTKGITSELVEQAVGSWRTQTVFAMLDLALAGNTAAAVRQLDALITAGEKPEDILPPISTRLRQLAMATELYLDSEHLGRKTSVREALEKVGVPRGYNDAIITKTGKQLVHLGRYRGTKLSDWLLQLNLAWRGDSKSEDRRLLLEMLIIKLSAAELREEI